MNLIAKKIQKYSSDTKGQYHRWLKVEGGYKWACEDSKYARIMHEPDESRWKIAARGDEQVALPIRQLCGICFSVRNIKVMVSPNESGILK